MHLTSLILLGCALACPLGMGAMIWFMGKSGTRRGHRSSPERDQSDD